MRLIVLIIVLMFMSCKNTCEIESSFDEINGYRIESCYNKKGIPNYKRIYNDSDIMTSITYTENGDEDSCHFWFRLNHKNDTLFVKDSMLLEVSFDSVNFNNWSDKSWNNKFMIEVYRDETFLHKSFAPKSSKMILRNSSLSNKSIFKLKIFPLFDPNASARFGYTSDSVYIKFDE